jgi:AraC-like DNA-binding protein
MLMLPDKTTSVTSVAFDCGFTNLGHFAKDYGKSFGSCPPKHSIAPKAQPQGPGRPRSGKLMNAETQTPSIGLGRLFRASFFVQPDQRGGQVPR